MSNAILSTLGYCMEGRGTTCTAISAIISLLSYFVSTQTGPFQKTDPSWPVKIILGETCPRFRYPIWWWEDDGKH